MSGSWFQSWKRWAVIAAAVAPVALVGCGGSDETGTPVLTWYINPDNGGQKTLAEECSRESNGAFTIAIQTLPNDADAQREQLVRRLAAQDESIDLMSLDPIFVPEFANAGYLMPITDPKDIRAVTEGVLESPLETAFWDDKLVSAPFWANTQLLWYRKSVAQAAGVDPTAENFTWDQAISAAEAQGKRFAVQARRYEGLNVWVNALIESGGGQILTDVEAGDEATPTVASPAGERAAEIIGRLGRSRAAPADIATATEEEARATFQSPDGAFMVNWPYTYGAAKEAVTEGALPQAVVDDIGWARYPRATADQPSRPPLGGINLGVGNFSRHPAAALAAVKCIVALPNNARYMVEAGNAAARGAAYDDPEVQKAFPMYDLIRSSIDDAGPRPQTPYYGDVSVSVQRNFYPPSEVRAGSTPQQTNTFMSEILRGERLL